ncbi:hypothetical protein ACFW4K_02645 [Nocardiopsis alba]|uniref:hypothetical protein n=1 Tax=Nocardiopsis alba TaxID=53437 RepID=UPI0036734FD3
MRYTTEGNFPMPESVDFDDLLQMEVLLRASMEFKFGISGDAEIFHESPVYASALNHVRESLISGLRSSSTPGKTQGYVELYRLSRFEQLWEGVARRASSHPRWHELGTDEMRQHVETIAAPLTVDDEMMEIIKTEAEKIIARDTQRE